MDAKQLTIVNLNSAKKALHSLKGKKKASYLQQILKNTKPDICLIPRNDTDLGLNVVLGYKQFVSPSGRGPVALYDPNRVSMVAPEELFVGCHEYGGLDLNEMIFPLVEVYSSQPQKHIARRFYLVSWNDTLGGNENDLRTRAENKIRFAQELAVHKNEAVLLAGELFLEHQVASNIVKKLSMERDADFLKDMQPEFEEHKFLPSMTESRLKPHRDLYMMKVVRSAHTDESNESDFFIASRKLELCGTNHLDISSVIESERTLQPGKSTSRREAFECMQSHRPMMTHVTIAPRPPTHHGG